MFVCGWVCKLVSFINDFSETTEPRILKFGTDVGYNFLYCVRENQPPPACHPLYLSFSFSQIKVSVTDFSASMRAKVFKFCIHIESDQVYCGKENQDVVINFAFFFHFSISHSNVKFMSKISQELLRLGF